MNKKIIITILLALVVMAGQGQNWSPLVEDSIDFIITGTTNSTQDSLIMFPCAPLGVREKYPIHNGKFTVTGRVRRHTFIQIDDNVNNSLRFIAEETPTYINLATDEVRGSELQKKFISCQMRERDIDNKTDRNAVIQQNIRENMNNIIPAYYLYSDYPAFTLEEMQEFIREDAPYARHPAMEWPWRAYLAKLKQKDITGKPFIDFEAEAPDSTIHRLSEFVGPGQYVLLDLWALHRGPYTPSFDFMKHLYATYKSQGFRIISVSCEQNRTYWLRGNDRLKLPWTTLRSPARKGCALDLYSMIGISALILIDRDGTIIAVPNSVEELKAKLEEIFLDNK